MSWRPNSRILHHELDKVAAGGNFGDAAREKFEGLRDKAEEAAKKPVSKRKLSPVNSKKSLMKFSDQKSDNKWNRKRWSLYKFLFTSF